MASQQSQGTSSPSASSVFLPLGRRGSRASVSTQAERESLHAALDQIHTAAYQSDALTVFNEFTSPPAPSSATDEKTISGELQGGLSGLYSRFRTSVGGIVSGVGKSSDKNTADDTGLKSPPSERSSIKPTHESSESHQQHAGSSQGSRLHSPAPGSQHSFQDSVSGAGKSAKHPPKSTNSSSKPLISPALKSPVPPLPKATGSSTAIDPMVTELHVNATHASSTNSVNLSTNSLQTVESAGTDREDGPHTASMSSSGWSQRLSNSPVLQVKSSSANEAPASHDISRTSTMGSQVPENFRRSDSQGTHEIEAALPGPLRKAKRSIDGTQDGIPFPPERLRSNSGASFSLDRINTASGSRTNSVTQYNSNEVAPFIEKQIPSGVATPLPMPDDEVQRKELPKPLVKHKTGERQSISSASRLPGYVASQASTAESVTGPPPLAPLNTSVDRVSGTDGRSWRPHASGDGVMSQLRSKLLSKEFWMRDENAKDCFHCGEPFSTFRRKHHCRTCGQIFDSKCTLLIPGDRFSQTGTIRVCKPCEAMINGHDDDSSEFSDSEQSPIPLHPRMSEFGGGIYPRIPSEEDDTSSVVSQSIEHVMKTPTMAIPATRRAGEGHNRRSAVLEISPDRPLARPTSSRSLKSSLSGRPHSMGHKRHHSRQQYIRSFKPHHDDRAPFQRRQIDDAVHESRLPAFHKDNIIDPDLAQYLSDDASSGEEQPNLMSAVSEGSLSKSGGESERTTFSGLLAAMKKGRHAFGDRSVAGLNSFGREPDDGSVSSSRAVNLPRASRRRNLSVASSIHQRHSPRASKDSMFNSLEQPPAVHVLPPGVPPSGFKMTRSSSMRGAGAPPVELNKASLQHVRKLLRQLLKDSSVPNVSKWETALLPILLKAADEVVPDVQGGDDMDIRHYIKLKKILGGRPGDTSYVSGLVFTKNLALKSMSRSIPQPKILIIAFPLEYARHQQHFMSLEPVIRQEREFLANLVSRIAALRPNLLLVEKNVSGLALELLEKANIATAYNVKSSVLEAVSRCTQTRIITSMDKLVTTPVHSDCGSFDVKTYVYNGRKKTYMYLSGCRKELGCTIVLRGGDSEVLAKVKRITEFMTYVVYNLKLETCLMRDEFAQMPALTDAEKEKKIDAGHDSSEGSSSSLPKDTITDPETASEVPDDVPRPTYYEDIVRDHETKVLSASPFVQFEPPYLLMRAREMERKLAYLKRLRDKDLNLDQSADEKAKSQKFILITPEMVHESPEGAPPKVKEVLRAAHDAEYDRALHHYQTQKRQWEAYVAGSVGLFDPYAHQNIVVLFSLVCTTTSIPCSGPDLLALEYYNEHGGDPIFEPDCTLGQYVEDICLHANAVCTANGCEKRMFEHHRQYVHGEAQISVFTQPYPSKLRGLQDTILMWSCCKICGNETQVFPMSESTWKYSFGKYLELSFWSKNLHARAGVCPHDLQRDHLRFFGFKDVAIRIHYDSINLLEIIVPRTRVTWKVDNDLKLRNEVYQRMEHRITRFMVSVKARLKGISVESVIPKQAEDCKTQIEHLSKKANEDHILLIKQLQEKYTNSRYWEVIPLNEVLRSVQEKVVEWDAAFAEFEKNFFPSEKDIKRLATLQLKKIFLDKDVSVIPEEPPTTPNEADNEIIEMPERMRLTRRMTLSPEKAQDVLVSVVEEHSGEKDVAGSQESDAIKSDDVGSATLSSSSGSSQFSPPQAEIAAEKEVQHLDLATPLNHSEHPVLAPPTTKAIDSQEPREPSEPLEPSEPKATSTDSDVNPTEPPPEEPSVRQRKKSDEIERTATPSRFPSAIPRLAEATLRRSGKSTSPPLFRAQTQPAPFHRDLGNDTTPIKGMKIAFGRLTPSDGAPSPPLDSRSRSSDNKKLSERFNLALRSGRMTPGSSLIPRSIPTRKNTRVSNLAKHFEQLSREFEKERQRERARRAAKGTHSRAIPIASSKPIVEVYKNVREAVEEREPSGEGEDFIPPASRLPPDQSGRNSEDMPRRDSEEESRQEDISQEPSAAKEEKEGASPEDENVLSEVEGEEHSDEDRDDLQRLDSNDELKMSPEDESMDLKEFPKHERSTLLKLLTNFWSERSASGWAPLDYPLTMSDHVFADCDIIVREDEPSSLIAFALDSSDYKEKLEAIQRRYEEPDEKDTYEEDGNDTLDETRVEHALLRSTGTHLKYQFQEGQAKMLCKVFYAEQFDALRKKCGVAERIVESLSRCAKWDSKGGKTKSLFLKTLDDRFILKSLSPIETQAFLKFAPAYFQIMSEALFHELPSAIAKMFGFYQVIIKNPATGTEFNWFLLLMENLFYDRVPTRIFDLKGSMRNRKVQSTGERNEVLLDENMVDFIYETPLFAREHSKKLLSQSVWNDTLFLGRQNVMDYSLMIAIDESRSELVVGVIDCIRTYTWDKKLESWIKDRGFAGGGKNRPTVTSPKEYKSRFREAMARYVLQAPSCWHQFQNSQLYRYAPVEHYPSQSYAAADADALEEIAS
ncbi:1-phosphatidylinositol-3-phosphate 5-kinase [Aspergillus costaricaensis CBS 115574]|uniref:1-phosphatidylinositol-3-phosphate 5-kinase n=1 Tax=Aspergillus costaricaensis CBS 115574 TaxID=1448317 RepID=A0ACD1INT2_9EURO|nr:1-phosphatidylinositol-3-phosphate 5-kinase [Aspergillus costaricaensis CBS 115574]RAK92231.1 1-phosphatidylinositol-3-phosphate 5-kinase [Aspergillus costaricaensis CBS 115574]